MGTVGEARSLSGAGTFTPLKFWSGPPFREVSPRLSFSTRPGGSMRVLIADDDPIALLYAQSVAVALDHEVALAETGEAALALVDSFQPHVIVTDWLMPGLSGVDLCQQVRAGEATRETYIIVYTALSTPEDRLEALGAGADDVLIKPIAAEDFEARLHLAERVTCGASASDETVLRAALARSASNDADLVRALAETYKSREDRVKARAFMRRQLHVVEAVLGDSHERVKHLRGALSALGD